MDIETTQFLLDLRRKVQANREAGRPAKEGITDEEHIKFLALLRPARSSATEPGEKKASSRKTNIPMSDAEADALFKL